MCPRRAPPPTCWPTSTSPSSTAAMHQRRQRREAVAWRGGNCGASSGGAGWGVARAAGGASVADATAARGRVLIAGTINTDLVARVRAAPAAGETVTGRDFAIFPGGKAANQAVAAARSGAPTAMLGAVGEDDFGRARRADLVREGIDVADVAETSLAASGVALIFVEESGENRIVYVPGATATVSAAQATAALRRVRPAVVLLTAEL